MSMAGGDGIRLLEWLAAVKRGKADARTEGAQVACFREHFIGADEGQTAGYAQSEVIWLLSWLQAQDDMRREGGRYDRER